MQHLEQTITFIASAGVAVVLIDIDGVMQDNAHRLHHIVEVVDGVQRKLKKPDWKAYTALASNDGPGSFAPIAKVLASSGTYLPVYLTARSGSTPEVRWALQERISELTGEFAPLIIMRPPIGENGKYESAHEYKRKAVHLLRAAGVQIAFAVDDSHQNCLMFKEEEIVTLRLYDHIGPETLNY